MAYTAHSDPEMMKERIDEKSLFDKKINQLVSYIKNSKHFIIFTGAGISTSAGIPDFRGPEGVWTLKAMGKKRTGKTVSSQKAYPTLTHMSIFALQNQGICKYLVSQNCDGLHRRSGIDPEKISELHGNGNIEYCEDCGRQYFRDFQAYRIGRGRDHYTGRHCIVKKNEKVCGGRLLEYTIDFGQSLPEIPLERAFENSKKADLCLVLGSSCTVTPAANIPENVAKRGKLVICNLQKTPLYDCATLNIHQKCDVVMNEVMKKLNIEIPIWELRRKILFGNDVDGERFKFYVQGIDTFDEELPATVIKRLKIVFPKQFKNNVRIFDKEPFIIQEKFPPNLKEFKITVTIQWMGWYNEKNVQLQHTVSRDGSKIKCSFSFRPDLRKWFLTKRDTCLNGSKTDKMMMDLDNVDQQVVVPKIFVNKIVPKDGKVSSRMWSTAVFYKNHMISFGGTRMNKSEQYPMIDYFDTENYVWKNPKVNGIGTDLPFINKARWGMSSNIINGKVFIIGGFDNECQYNDTHVYNLSNNTLQEVNTTGQKMSYRAMHSSVVFNNNIIIFGGCFCSGGPYVHFNDIFILNVENNVWNKIQCKGEVPEGRSQHCANIIGTRMIISGGINEKQTFNDFHMLNLENFTWTKINVQGQLYPSKKIQPRDFRINAIRNTSLFFLSPFSILHGICVMFGKDGLYIYQTKDNTLQKIDVNLEPFNCHIAVAHKRYSILMLNDKNELFEINLDL